MKLQVDAEEAAILSTIFDVGGIIGGIIAGTLSDKTGKPASTCAIMLVSHRNEHNDFDRHLHQFGHFFAWPGWQPFFLGGGDTNYADLWACSGQLVCSQTVFLAIYANVVFSSQSPRCKITSSHGEPVHNACFNWNIALTLITGILVNGVISILCAHGLFTPLFQDHTPW